MKRSVLIPIALLAGVFALAALGCADETSTGGSVADPGAPQSAPSAPGSTTATGPNSAPPAPAAQGPVVAPPTPADNACASGHARSISQFGITWTFSEERECGTYVNGDYWVLGPVTLTQIAPAPTDGRHGTVINPKVGSDQGFDKDLKSGIYENKYVPALNVGKTMPLQVVADSSVVSSITADGWTEFHTLESVAILTVVAEKPQEHSFRPPYVGDGPRKSAFRYANVNHGKLGRLSRVPFAGQVPSLPEATAMFSRPWYEQNVAWTGRYMHLAYQAGPNGKGYGRNLALRTGDAALLLNLDFTAEEKRDLLVGFVQYGIDIAGILQKGGEWFADGGHNVGRLAPALVAAHVLGDAALGALVKGSAMKFQEFQQTFSVSQADVNITNRQGTNGGKIEGYTAADLGMAEWGIRHSYEPQKDNRLMNAKTDAAYRDVAGSTLTGVAMAAKAMGAKTLMDWEPLFGYVDRHLAYERGPNGSDFNFNPTPAFHQAFYTAYH